MKIAQKIALFAIGLLLLSCLFIGGASIFTLNEQLKQKTLAQQHQSLRTVALMVKHYYPDLSFDVTKEGHIEDIRLNDIPEFTDHTVIDLASQATGDTATVFTWDDTSRDFWRKTTNIIKPDGNRAVGTPLGQNGSVYPVIMSGNTFIGEATILGKDYFTLYEPIRNTQSEIIGILYVGVEKEKVDALFNSMVVSIVTSAAFVLVLLLLLTSWLARKGVQPLSDLTLVMKDLAQGDLSVSVPHQDKKDELGDMARAVKIFKSNAVERETLQQDKSAQEAKERDHQAAIQNATQSFDQHVTHMLDTIQQAVTDLNHSASTLSEDAKESSHRINSVATTTQQT